MSASLTTRQAAQRLGVTDSRIRHLVLEGRLPAEKFGRDLMIRERDLRLVEDRKVGRPPKAAIAKRKHQRNLNERNHYGKPNNHRAEARDAGAGDGGNKSRSDDPARG